ILASEGRDHVHHDGVAILKLHHRDGDAPDDVHLGRPWLSRVAGWDRDEWNVDHGPRRRPGPAFGSGQHSEYREPLELRVRLEPARVQHELAQAFPGA